MKARKIIWVFVVLFVFAGGLKAQITEESLKFGEVLQTISKYYVDTVNEDKLVEKVIVDMLHELDPHSNYLTKAEVEASQELLEGGFEGIGVSFNILRDTIFIINTIPGGPSELVGIKAGDRIVKIEGENVAGIEIKNVDVQKKLKGKKGTKVDIGIMRKNVDKLMDFTITRDEIPIYSLDASYMIDDNTGYIKLSRFSSTTVDEFKKAMVELEARNMQNLILDLSGNGGGYLWAAVDLADQFISGRRMLVYTQGDKNPRRNFYSTDNGNFIDGKLVVMIDEGSASASEIVSGALQDWDRAVIVGRRSFGKGLVQGRFELRDGSELRLTVAKYYTPSGRLIQKPYDEGFEEYAKELTVRYRNGELNDEATKNLPDSLKFNTLLNNRVVYGGGGIMPDYSVPIDTSKYSEYYRELISQGVLNQFILSYVDNNRKYFESTYTNFDKFNREFTVTSEMEDKLIQYAESEGIEYVAGDYETSKEMIYMLFKAYIARDIWDTSQFYHIYNQSDPVFKKALEVIEHESMYEAKLREYQKN